MCERTLYEIIIILSSIGIVALSERRLKPAYIRSSHKFVPFFERLYMLRSYTYLSVSWKNVIALSLYNFFPFFKCIRPLSPYVYKSTREMYTQKSARTYGMT